jgi:hypothetical protein
MFKPEVIEEIGNVAAEFGLETAALLAVAEIESGGHTFAAVAGRREPLIRFEGHYFDRRLSAENRSRARSLRLSSPTAGAIPNPASQAARWQLLDRAAAINRIAAWESTSWGLGQVMGAHWKWLGYADVETLVSEARSSAAGQARLMARYIVKAGLADALRQRDWAAFARGYNGPGYRANRYDAKLAQAFARHSSATSADTGPRPATTEPAGRLLKHGDRGAAVADVQVALTAAGYPVRADGVFGPLTAEAVRRYQRDHGLVVDGIAGPSTLSSLRASLSLWNRIGRFCARLATLFGRSREKAA